MVYGGYISTKGIMSTILRYFKKIRNFLYQRWSTWLNFVASKMVNLVKFCCINDVKLEGKLVLYWEFLDRVVSGLATVKPL